MVKNMSKTILSMSYISSTVASNLLVLQAKHLQTRNNDDLLKCVFGFG